MQKDPRSALREGALIFFLTLMLVGLLLSGCVAPQTRSALQRVGEQVALLKKELKAAKEAGTVTDELRARLDELRKEKAALEERATAERLESAGRITSALAPATEAIPVAGPLVALILGAVGQFLTGRSFKRENGNA